MNKFLILAAAIGVGIAGALLTFDNAEARGGSRGGFSGGNPGGSRGFAAPSFNRGGGITPSRVQPGPRHSPAVNPGRVQPKPIIRPGNPNRPSVRGPRENGNILRCYYYGKTVIINGKRYHETRKTCSRY